MNHLVTIIGPTGIGKSHLAIQLAQTFDGEIVSADSRQVYHHMDIGTAKPSREMLSLVPHHLINILNPDEDFSLAQYQELPYKPAPDFSLAQYQELAYKAIRDIQQRDKLPILVGGSGMYVWSVLEGWGIPRVPPDPQFRQGLEQKACGINKDVLYQELEKVDPVAAQSIDRRNVRRTIRALEVYRNTNSPASQLQSKEAPPFSTLIIGLTMDRAELYRRIDSRIDEMVEQGWVAEVEKLQSMGYDFKTPAMSSIGYKQIGMFLNNEITLAATIQQIKYETHRFVRHQYNWFQLKDERIKWFDMQNQAYLKITTLLDKFN